MENPYIVVEQKQEKKRRGALAILLAIAFCAILAIGSTFAYLTWTANQTPNRVTTGELTADLLEPAYTTQAVSDNTDADGNVNATTGTLFKAGDGVAIPANAYSVVPGSQFQKNPFVVNTSKATTAKGYAGIKLEFQKWVATDTSGNDKGKWTTMSQEEVNKIMKIYNIGKTQVSTTATSTATVESGGTLATAGFHLLGDGWQQLEPTMSSDDTPAVTGYTGVLSTAPTSDADTTNVITATPEMYFINTNALTSMGELKHNNASDVADFDNNAETTNWGYTLDNSKGATTALFNYVTCIPSASQTDITAVNDILKYSQTAALASGKTFTPGWRIVCSGAILQDIINPSDSSSTTEATATAAKNYNLDMKAKLDAVSSTNGNTDTDDKKYVKPSSATGTRENLAGNFSQYLKNNEATNANAIPEPSPNNL